MMLMALPVSWASRAINYQIAGGSNKVDLSGYSEVILDYGMAAIRIAPDLIQADHPFVQHFKLQMRERAFALFRILMVGDCPFNFGLLKFEDKEQVLEHFANQPGVHILVELADEPLPPGAASCRLSVGKISECDIPSYC